MKRSVDDVHGFEEGYLRAKERIEKMETSQHNKNLIDKFTVNCRKEGLTKSTITTHINYLKWTIEHLNKMGFTKDIDQLEQDDFDHFLIYLEDEVSASKGTIRNYKKTTKKFYRFITDDDLPKWVQKLKLQNVETPVQPSDLPSKEDINKMIEACTNARDKAIVTVLYDGGLRPGALASCRIKNVAKNDYGSIIYLSKTSKANKTTPPKGIPLTWSSGFLEQWIAVHPLREDPDAPLWITLDKNQTPMSYKTMRVTIKKIAKRAGIESRFYPYLLRHTAITNWVLDGLNEQEIKHRAGWSRGSDRMLKVYANFTDQEINENIYEKYGLKTENKRHVTLHKCPRCSNVLRPEDRFCSQCSLVLDQDMNAEMEKSREQIPASMQLLMDDPDIKNMLSTKMSEMQKQIEK